MDNQWLSLDTSESQSHRHSGTEIWKHKANQSHNHDLPAWAAADEAINYGTMSTAILKNCWSLSVDQQESEKLLGTAASEAPKSFWGLSVGSPPDSRG